MVHSPETILESVAPSESYRRSLVIRLTPVSRQVSHRSILLVHDRGCGWAPKCAALSAKVCWSVPQAVARWFRSRAEQHSAFPRITRPICLQAYPHWHPPPRPIKKHIEKLDRTLEVRFHVGCGTQISLRFPLTRFRGLDLRRRRSVQGHRQARQAQRATLPQVKTT